MNRPMFLTYSPYRTCPKCQETKPADAFHKNATTKDGLQAYCKPCQNASTQRWRKKRPDYSKDWSRLNRYGITPEQYAVLKEAGCQACGTKDAVFHIDHDHKCCPDRQVCGKCTRGLLCHHCNLALGNTKESIPTLLGLIEYIKKWSNAPL